MLQQEELLNIKLEKAKLDVDIFNLQRELAQQQAEGNRINSELAQQKHASQNELLQVNVELNAKNDEVTKLKEEMEIKDTIIAQLTEKEAQIRKIAKRYKDQFLELENNIDSFRTDVADNTNQLEVQVQQLRQEIESVQRENDQLRQQSQELGNATTQKEDELKQLLVTAKGIMNQLRMKLKFFCRKISSEEYEQMSIEFKQFFRDWNAQSHQHRLEENFQPAMGTMDTQTPSQAMKRPIAHQQLSSIPPKVMKITIEKVQEVSESSLTQAEPTIELAPQYQDTSAQPN